MNTLTTLEHKYGSGPPKSDQLIGTDSTQAIERLIAEEHLGLVDASWIKNFDQLWSALQPLGLNPKYVAKYRRMYNEGLAAELLTLMQLAHRQHVRSPLAYFLAAVKRTADPTNRARQIWARRETGSTLANIKRRGAEAQQIIQRFSMDIAESKLAAWAAWAFHSVSVPVARLFGLVDDKKDPRAYFFKLAGLARGGQLDVSTLFNPRSG